MDWLMIGYMATFAIGGLLGASIKHVLDSDKAFTIASLNLEIKRLEKTIDNMGKTIAGIKK